MMTSRGCEEGFWGAFLLCMGRWNLAGRARIFFRCRALGFSVLGLVFIGEGIVISSLFSHDSNNTNGFNILHPIWSLFILYASVWPPMYL